MAGGISWLRASCVICGILLATLLLSKSSPVRGVVVVTSDGVKAQREFSLRAQPLLRHIGDTAIFDSGVPPQHYQTGGIVWAGQTLGLRFVPKPATRQHLLKAAATTAWAVTSITLYVGADRVHPGEQGITLSLCASSPDTGLPADDCISEPFNMQRVHQVEAEWRPAAAWNFRVRSGEASWFIVQVRLERLTQPDACVPVLRVQYISCALLPFPISMVLGY